MLSIAIATMRRWDFLKDSLPLYLDRPQVKEVILCDETGEDCEAARASPFGSHPKLRLVTNEKRLGIYQNKRKAFSLAKGEWVAILDSDNYFSEEWFDVLEEVLPRNAPKQILASAEFKTTNLDTGDVTMPCKDFTGCVFDRHTWNRIFHRPKWNFLLNDGNWVVHYSALQFLPKDVPSDALQAADAIWMLRKWIEAGFSIWYVPELSYIHTVHKGSSWLATEKESTHILNSFDWTIKS
jgi:glycosyltransferase involved in cell wall biosynthesis